MREKASVVRGAVFWVEAWGSVPEKRREEPSVVSAQNGARALLERVRRSGEHGDQAV